MGTLQHLEFQGLVLSSTRSVPSQFQTATERMIVKRGLPVLILLPYTTIIILVETYLLPAGATTIDFNDYAWLWPQL